VTGFLVSKKALKKEDFHGNTLHFHTNAEVNLRNLQFKTSHLQLGLWALANETWAILYLTGITIASYKPSKADVVMQFSPGLVKTTLTLTLTGFFESKISMFFTESEYPPDLCPQ
jgi:hypothetical protein